MKDWLKNQLARLGLGAGAEAAAAAATNDTPPPVVLLVDDNPTNLQILVETLKPMGYRLQVAKDGATALNLARRTPPAVVLLDVMMPEMDGYEVCRRLKADPDLKRAAVIFCSALTDTEAKVKGLQLGAVDFVTKPFQPDEITARVGTHLAVQQLAASLQVQNEALRHELEVAREQHHESLERLKWALGGSSSAVRQLRAAIEAQAADDAPLLLTGAPSCGDEAVARAIHAASRRQDGPFIMVDCSRLAAGDDAAIFDSGRRGQSKLALAQGGTIYFEHLHQLPVDAQERLAAVVQEASTRARIIAFASTERPESTFPPLFSRLGQNAVRLPTLAERRDDVLPLATEILLRQARKLGKPARDLKPEAAKRLEAHDWPGNLRELEEVVTRSVALSLSAHVEVDEGLLQSGRPLGSYRLLQKLGAGGMGEVWTARHQLLARPAAVKLMLADGGSDAESIERFRREATATSQLASPHTVTLFDFGVGEGGEFYYVMELLDGMDLDAMVADGTPLPPARVAHFVVQACKSLAEAHAAGIVHRDLKPSNMFACRLGLEVDFLKILDFGLALRRGPTPDEDRLTQKDQALGTPDYMAPESIRGASQIDGRTDMYSLGATAFHLLTGYPVFSGNTMQKILKHANDPPPPLPAHLQVPQSLSDLVTACLAKDMQARPTAEQMWTAIENSGLPQQWTPREARAWWDAHRTPTPRPL